MLTSSLTTHTLISEMWRYHHVNCDHAHTTRTTFKESQKKKWHEECWKREVGEEMAKTIVNQALKSTPVTWHQRICNMIYTFSWLMFTSKPEETKSESHTTSVHFLESVTLSLKFSFTDEYIKVLPAHINKYITRLSRLYINISKKVKLTVFTTEGY